MFQNFIRITSYNVCYTKLLRALKMAEDNAKGKDIYICGGEHLYKEAIDIANVMFITVIDELFEGDTFFPEFDESKFELYVAEYCVGEIPYTYLTFNRITSYNVCYTKLLRDVEFNRELLVQLLEDEYELVTAADGAEGLTMVEKERPDLILIVITSYSIHYTKLYDDDLYRRPPRIMIFPIRILREAEVELAKGTTVGAL